VYIIRNPPSAHRLLKVWRSRYSPVRFSPDSPKP